ncbi:MAG: hypothetical protein R3B45_14995 [Bdellovibrionota bacterium]
MVFVRDFSQRLFSIATGTMFGHSSVKLALTVFFMTGLLLEAPNAFSQRVWESEAKLKTRSFLRDIADGTSNVTAFNLRVGGRRTNEYRYKVGAANAVDCLVEQGYSDWTSTRERLIFDLSQTLDEAKSLCLLGRLVRKRRGVVVEQDIAKATSYHWAKVTNDTVPPENFSIIAPTGTITTDTPTLSWQSANGADYYDVILSQNDLCQDPIQEFSGLTSTSVAISTPLADGAYFICVGAFDFAGNATSALNNPLSFIVDAIDDVPPGVFDITAPTGTVNTSMPTVQWTTSTDAVAYDLTIAFDTSCFLPAVRYNDLTGTSFTLPTSLLDNTYYVCMTSKDQANNMTTASNNGLQFIVDAIDDVPPGPFDILGPVGTLDIDAPTISWTASQDAVKYNIFIATDAECINRIQTILGVIGTSVGVVAPLQDGDYFTCMSSEDSAGNQTAATNNGLAFTIDAVDTAPPGPFDVVAPSGDVLTQTPTFSWTASVDAVSYDLTIASDASCTTPVLVVTDILDISHTLTTALAPDTYSSCVRAYDQAGNFTDATNNGLAFTVKAPLPAHHEIFVTSAVTGLDGSPAFPPSYPEFGHLDAADWICSFAAADGGRNPGWDGLSTPWKALLSVPGVNANSRIFVQAPVYNTNGDLLAADYPELWSGSLQAPVLYDEFGQAITHTFEVFTGTNYNGTTVSDRHCNFWSSTNSTDFATAGDARLSDQEWMEGAGDISCSQGARLYCISPMIPAQ